MAKLGFKVGKFLVAGIPGLLVAIPLNYLLVRLGGWPEWGAYGVVLVVQVSINFLACRYFVFDADRSVPLLRQYAAFVSGILGFRLADWALYAVLVEYFGVPFLLAQIFNAGLFAVMKFKFSQRVLEGKRG